MEPVYFGSDAWKNHSLYDDRFESADSYNEDFQMWYQVGKYEPTKRTKRTNPNKNHTTYTDVQIAIKNRNINHTGDIMIIIGAGVSGLTIAMHLSKKHRVTLYEANNYLGGHALTLNEKILVNNKLTDINFDVGFLVYNNKNYPLFSELLNLLKV